MLKKVVSIFVNISKALLTCNPVLLHLAVPVGTSQSQNFNNIANHKTTYGQRKVATKILRKTLR